MEQKTASHRDLLVWQKSVALSLEIYKLTDKFPQREVYGISSQMRRAAVSIASNIAEGRNRRSRADFAHFLQMAYGSAAELETQLLICKGLKFCSEEQYAHMGLRLTEISKMLHVMIEKLNGSARS